MGLMGLASDFIFAMCQRGAEPALKRELHREGFLPAFMRPGFVTLKRSADRGPVELEPSIEAVFARRIGLSLGIQREESLKKAVEGLIVRLGPRPLPKLHLFSRDEEMASQLAIAETSLRGDLAGRFTLGVPAEPGDLVIDVILVDPEKWCLGAHVQSTSELGAPGGALTVVVPEAAPSRAYAKLVEGLAWSHAPMREGEVALELGSAPGGAAYALLERGLRVVGVDAAKMDRTVLANPRFRHVKKVLRALSRDDLPERPDWILSDMNVDPDEAFDGLAHVLGLVGRPPRGFLLTLKLNQWSFAERLDAYFDRARALGMKKLAAKQLASHHRELLLFGLCA
jgi:23S rRNA (cytidine2498-2'-O)-methyltransferase